MKLAARKSATIVAAAATAGASTLMFGVAPAGAADVDACGEGTLIAPGVCELSFTSGTTSFTAPASATQLEMLLVGAGGSGADQTAPNTNGYAAAGGGGQVTYVDFSGSADPIDVTVGTAGGADTSAADGTTSATAVNGNDAVTSEGSNSGGASGDGEFSGSTGTLAGGGGAGGDADAEDGGDGVVVADLVASVDGSLFAGDDRCFGGGGAAGSATVQGIPGCGAGGPVDALGTGLFAPVANSGGGGGGLTTTQSAELRAGADGVVIARWNGATVALTFDVKGHGVAPASQTVIAGTAPVKPADPTASGYTFDGWFVDAALTVPADFTAPLSASTTYYAKWTAALAATGSTADAAALPIGLATLVAGAGILIAASRRRRQA